MPRIIGSTSTDSRNVAAAPGRKRPHEAIHAHDGFFRPARGQQSRRRGVPVSALSPNDGYDMIQFSVYGRILNGNDAEEKHMKRLVANFRRKAPRL